MIKRSRLLLACLLVAAGLAIHGPVLGAYWVCDDCGCHIGHEDCWFYEHEDVCNPGASGNCYLHIDDSCSGAAEAEG